MGCSKTPDGPPRLPRLLRHSCVAPRKDSASGAASAPAHGELVEPGAGAWASVVARTHPRRGRGNLGRGCAVARWPARGTLPGTMPPGLPRLLRHSCVAPRKDSAGGAASAPAHGELVEPGAGAWASVVARTRPRRGRGNLGQGRRRCRLACAWDTPRYRASPPPQIASSLLRRSSHGSTGSPGAERAATPAHGELVEPGAGARASVVARTRPRRGRGNLGRGRRRCPLACAWDAPRHRASPPHQIASSLLRRSSQRQCGG